jgi:uncharacterized protein (TIGR02444 family)
VTLWEWATRAYARPQVGALCLALQDEYGQGVSYLLWAVWAARQSRPVDQAALDQAASLAREWESSVLRPLRSVRRALKPQPGGLAVPGQDELRGRIKAEELAAERLLLEALETRTPPVTGAAVDARQALRDAAAAWGPTPPKTLLDALSRAFSNA